MRSTRRATASALDAVKAGVVESFKPVNFDKLDAALRVSEGPARVGAFIFSPAGLGLAYSHHLIPRVAPILAPAISN